MRFGQENGTCKLNRSRDRRDPRENTWISFEFLMVKFALI